MDQSAFDPLWWIDNQLPPDTFGPSPIENFEVNGSVAAQPPLKRRHVEDVPETPANNRSSIPLACLACRSRHLKCDGATPCSRCSADNSECQYVKSRRGWRGPRKNCAKPALESSNSSTLDVQNHRNDSIQETVVRSDDSNSSALSGYPTSTSFIASRASDISGSLDTYYNSFHAAHPFLPTRSHLTNLLVKRPLRHLELGIQYVSSFYRRDYSSEIPREALRHTLADVNLDKDGFVVQAMLLFAIGLHMDDRAVEADNCLAAVTALAQELGMHCQEYALKSCNGCPVLEESWRRTWWQLCLVDALCASANNKPLRLGNAAPTVDLPCEEAEYNTGQIPPPHTLADYEDSDFMESTFAFSSFAYQIHAVGILVRIMTAIRQVPFEEASLTSIETSLANFTLTLPPSKSTPLNRAGNVDEVLFTAHMVIAACNLVIHRPRSDLRISDVEDVYTCVSASSSILPSSARETHTALAMRSARSLASLASLPGPHSRHTPFFACAMTMAAVVNLSYWSYVATDGSDAALKEQIRLCVGVLKGVAGTWPIARAVFNQVKAVAGALYRARRRVNGFDWGEVTRREVLGSYIGGEVAYKETEEAMGAS
ncbi:hypothetical protein K402DRAFT_373848 [Aulographum hederae CBS 113979]|uniref:Zn(2)-C6 fungal-type domain-containing protein n=1 Tax=Aulographum hederae CBS 113979 TaxID=1176131 RepID=A0A6G1H6M4_9PEZI|nr:hypothetical protein K402DRAFT_373848 [Aulographum hederae CBS 113979]